MHNFFVIVIILMFADEKVPQNKCIIFFLIVIIILMFSDEKLPQNKCIIIYYF